jgi:hypothetical protein
MKNCSNTAERDADPRAASFVNLRAEVQQKRLDIPPFDIRLRRLSENVGEGPLVLAH